MTRGDRAAFEPARKTAGAADSAGPAALAPGLTMVRIQPAGAVMARHSMQSAVRASTTSLLLVLASCASSQPSAPTGSPPSATARASAETGTAGSPPSATPGASYANKTACAANAAEGACVAAGCRYLVAGCDAPPGLPSGCFPTADCSATGCPTGEQCLDYVFNPCRGRPDAGAPGEEPRAPAVCAACGAITHVCMAPR